jgi:transposase
MRRRCFMGKLYVGIDISKDRSSANGIDEHGKSRFEISFDMDGTGFAELLKAIEANSKDNEGVVAGMESTACYHINLYSFLSAKNIEAVVINPLLIANFAKLSLRKTKTDKKDASTFLAKIGPIDNYTSHKNLIAFAGIDPTVYQSGKYEVAGKISKKGNRHLRRVIWIMTVRVIKHNPTFRKYFFKKRNEGQPFKQAVFATAHKLVRVIFAMLSHRTYFQEECI